MKAFLAAIIIALVLILAVKPLRLQATIVATQAGFLEPDCGGMIVLIYPPPPCNYKFNLFGPFQKFQKPEKPLPNFKDIQGR